jgi:hypothetical protein
MAPTLVEASRHETSVLEMFQSLINLTEVQRPERAKALVKRSLDRIPMDFPAVEKSKKGISK